MSYKLLFAITAANDFEIKQMDVKTAFLYSNINTEIYMKQSKKIRAIRESHKIYKLNKTFYSLKQSSHVWYFTLTAYLKTFSFKPLTTDNCIFHNSKGTYIAVFINNLFMVGLFKANIFKIKTKLSKHFYITDLGLCKYYFGIKVIKNQQNQTLKLSQQNYLEKVLCNFGMWCDRTV